MRETSQVYHQEIDKKFFIKPFRGTVLMPILQMKMLRFREVI